MKRYNNSHWILLLFLCFGITACHTDIETPEHVVQQYFIKANELVKGDSTQKDYLYKHLSQAALAQVSQIPLLLPYSLVANTHKGTLKQVLIQEKKALQPDSMTITLLLVYISSPSQKIKQSMVKQEGNWKLGLSQ